MRTSSPGGESRNLEEPGLRSEGSAERMIGEIAALENADLGLLGMLGDLLDLTDGLAVLCCGEHGLLIGKLPNACPIPGNVSSEAAAIPA